MLCKCFILHVTTVLPIALSVRLSVQYGLVTGKPINVEESKLGMCKWGANFRLKNQRSRSPNVKNLKKCLAFMFTYGRTTYCSNTRPRVKKTQKMSVHKGTSAQYRSFSAIKNRKEGKMSRFLRLLNWFRSSIECKQRMQRSPESPQTSDSSSQLAC